jgi:3-dehydroquinate synthase
MKRSLATMEEAQECEQPSRRTIPVIGKSCVHVGRGLLRQIPAELTPANGIKATRFVLVSDENVWKIYGPQLVASFLALGDVELAPCLNAKEPSSKPMGFADRSCSCGEAGDDGDGDVADSGKRLLVTYTVKHGEGSKSREVKAAIEDCMLAHRCNRDTCMLALGGGVVGDLVGYVAATYMRGVPYVQIPTSTTAMIDSSVGGKTAINVPAGKNLIGAFWQPACVYADMDLLSTLGRRELVEGISEAIKMGLIRMPALFETLERQPERVMALAPELIDQVIYDSIRGKAEVVAADEREAGLRGTLNWGHTIGHAIEALKSPAMMHGECVAIGCVAEAELSLRMGNESLSRAKIDRITRCFASYGLPIHVPRGLAMDLLMRKMSLDKKNQGNSIRCTIVTDIGVSMTNPQPVEKALMRSVMQESMEAGLGLKEWVPHEGRVAVVEAGGQMSR